MEEHRPMNINAKGVHALKLKNGITVANSTDRAVKFRTGEILPGITRTPIPSLLEEIHLNMNWRSPPTNTSVRWEDVNTKLSEGWNAWILDFESVEADVILIPRHVLRVTYLLLSVLGAMEYHYENRIERQLERLRGEVIYSRHPRVIYSNRFALL